MPLLEPPSQAAGNTGRLRLVWGEPCVSQEEPSLPLGSMPRLGLLQLPRVAASMASACPASVLPPTTEPFVLPLWPKTEGHTVPMPMEANCLGLH